MLYILTIICVVIASCWFYVFVAAMVDKILTNKLIKNNLGEYEIAIIALTWIVSIPVVVSIETIYNFVDWIFDKFYKKRDTENDQVLLEIPSIIQFLHYKKPTEPILDKDS